MSLKKGLVLDLDISSEGLQGTTKFKDKTPYENNGTLSNVTLTTDHKGKANSAGLFNGTSSYIDCGNFQHLPLFTLSAWIKAGEDVTTYRTIFDKTDGLSSRNYWLSIDASTGILTLRFSVDGAAKVFYAKKINDNLWHHIVVTYDNSYVRFYIDGVIYSSGEQTGLPGNASSNLYVGYQRVDPTRKFYGSIERPQIWNRALSADEVKLLYESYNPCLKMTRALKGTFVDSRDGTE